MEIRTNALTEQEFRDEFGEIVGFLTERRIAEVAIAFGFSEDYPELEDVGIAQVVPVAQMTATLAERERTKGFQFGYSDCWVNPIGLEAQFLFCNDRDVHVTSDSPELLDRFRRHWRSRGFHVYPDDLEAGGC